MNEEFKMKNEELWSVACLRTQPHKPFKFIYNLGQDVVLNAVRLNNSFTKMQIRASKLAHKHFYSLLHPELCVAKRQEPLKLLVSLRRDVAILSFA